MNLGKVVLVILGSIVVGILGAFATRNIFIGIGLPIVLCIFAVMWFAVKGKNQAQPPVVEEKKEEPTQKSDV